MNGRRGEEVEQSLADGYLLLYEKLHMSDSVRLNAASGYNQNQGYGGFVSDVRLLESYRRV